MFCQYESFTLLNCESYNTCLESAQAPFSKSKTSRLKPDILRKSNIILMGVLRKMRMLPDPVSILSALLYP